MSLPLVVNALAEAEIDDARDYYDSRRSGLGDDFLACVEEVLDRIRDAPLLYAAVRTDIREALVHRFPYAIYYRTTDAQSTVIAVHHTSRDPRSWQSRA